MVRDGGREVAISESDGLSRILGSLSRHAVYRLAYSVDVLKTRVKPLDSTRYR